jgi:hypothetical protein
MVLFEKAIEIENGGTKDIVTFKFKDETNLCGGGWFSFEGVDKAGSRRFYFQNKSRAVVESHFQELLDSIAGR